LFIGFDGYSFVDFSQMCGQRLGFFLNKKSFSTTFKVRINSYFIHRSDELLIFDISYLMRIQKLYTFYPWNDSLSGMDGFCYSRLFSRYYQSFACQVLGQFPTLSRVQSLFGVLELCKLLSKNNSRIYSDQWLSFVWTGANSIHLVSWREGNGNAFVYQRKFFEMGFHPSLLVGGPEPLRVALTDDGIEEDIISLMGGDKQEIKKSRRKVENWSNDGDFRRSCELRFGAIEGTLEKLLSTMEKTVGNTVVPEDSASRVGDRRYLSGSMLPVVDEVAPSGFDVVHPGWRPDHYENDLSLATGCSGVINGEVSQLPDPGAGGLVPAITIDQRLNFLIRIHTALFKLLTDKIDYPGENFLMKFKQLRDGKTPFDHPSLDLLEIVLEDTVDWRKHIVKRNLFKISGFHPGLLLTERSIGNALVSLREEYKIRWNSLVGDCVLPSMLSNVNWSDDRKKLSDERQRRHKISEKRRMSDVISSTKGKSGWSQLSSL
jgi:hypothetical protein